MDNYKRIIVRDLKMPRKNSPFIIGQSLVEVLIALTVITVVLLSIITAVIVSLKSATISRNRSRATFLAQQGLEWARAQRTRDGWDQVAGLASPGGMVYCLDVFPIDVASMTAGECDVTELIDTTYAREITFSEDNATDIGAEVTVAWGPVLASTGEPMTVRVATVFSNWEVTQ